MAPSVSQEPSWFNCKDEDLGEGLELCCWVAFGLIYALYIDHEKWNKGQFATLLAMEVILESNINRFRILDKALSFSLSCVC